MAHGKQATLTAILTQRLEELAYRKTQRDIAKVAGFQNANAISLLKAGKMKLPLDRVPAMAKALEMDTDELMVPALRQYYSEEVIAMIASAFSDARTDTERELVQIARRHIDTRKPLTNEQRQALAEIFTGTHHHSA